MYIHKYFFKLTKTNEKLDNKTKMLLFLKGCDNGLYGVDCSKTCGRCLNESHCFHINGSCLTGCDAGYEGDACKTRTYCIKKKVKKNAIIFYLC